VLDYCILENTSYPIDVKGEADGICHPHQLKSIKYNFNLSKP
jgi:hypothetical protein